MKFLLSLLFLLLVIMTTTAQHFSIEYSLSMSNPSTHLFEAAMQLNDLPSSKTVEVKMAAWRTGRYAILDFAGMVQEFSATNEKKEILPWKKIDKETWSVEKKGAKHIIIRYNVYANEFNMRTRELNSEHAFLDPLAVFMYTEQTKNNPLQLTITPYGNWHVTTGLEQSKDHPLVFTAPNFEYFGDCPIEIGNQFDKEFFVEGKKHLISIYGEGNWNADTLVKDFTAIIKANLTFWGALPYNQYIFFLHCQPNAGGGTEHINSTVMGVRPFVFEKRSSYLNFLGLVSHEYFHTWNVKQLRPKAFAPYDFSKENYTEELWLSEGGTSYLDNLILIYAGIEKADSYLAQIPSMAANEKSRYGNSVQPLSESSFDAWIKFWRNRENALNAQSDYYGKGAQFSLLLDLELRHRSKNNTSLQKVMRTMFEQFPKTKGFINSDFQKMCEKLSGVSLERFFKQYLYGTTPLPWKENLFYAGLELFIKDSSAKKIDAGLLLSSNNGKTIVGNVAPGSPAERAGIEINDELLALNGFRTSSVDFNERISSYKSGDTLQVVLFRNDKIKEISLTLFEFGVSEYGIKKAEHPSELQKTIYESWLQTKWSESE
ncbi:MAG: M61 family metallopeptidase [Bacteroidetes bacterium]|nr:M61 family metallopeptidase [Bacteroidota bacterium]